MVNLKREVINGIDSSLLGEWASLTFRQHIQIWKTKKEQSDNCATIKYSGQFDAFAGALSPGSGSKLSGQESGTYQGGLRFSFDGTFTPGTSATKGSIGTYNQGCEQTIASCKGPSSIDWVSDYFSGVSYDDFWYGFIYHGGNAGTYVATSNRQEGDILLK